MNSADKIIAPQDENLIKHFSELTGLSEQTITTLIMYKSLFEENEHPNKADIVNAFFESKQSTELFSYLKEYISKVRQEHQNYTHFFANINSYENTKALFADYPVSLEREYNTAIFMASQCLIEFAKSQVKNELDEIDKMFYE